jgi:hypothetical protein
VITLRRFRFHRKRFSRSPLAIAGPTARYGFFYGLHAGVLYLWSGAQGTFSIDPAQDTWAFGVAAQSWSQLLDGSEAGAPAGRRNGALVLDPVVPRLVIFGGTADGATNVPGLTFLDLSRRSSGLEMIALLIAIFPRWDTDRTIFSARSNQEPVSAVEQRRRTQCTNAVDVY